MILAQFKEIDMEKSAFVMMAILKIRISNVKNVKVFAKPVRMINFVYHVLKILIDKVSSVLA